MKVVYLSYSGMVSTFLSKLGVDGIEIDPSNPFIKILEPYILIVPTYDEVMTECVNDFIEYNDIDLLEGVIGSGNLNFADLYVFTAKNIAKEYNVPLLHAFEYSGNDDDVTFVKNLINKERYFGKDLL